MRTLPCFLFCKITTLLGERKCTDGLATTASYSLQKKKRERYYCNHSLVTPHAERPRTVTSTDPFFECIRECGVVHTILSVWLTRSDRPLVRPLFAAVTKRGTPYIQILLLVIVLFLQLVESQEPNRSGGHGQSKSLHDTNETTARSWLRPGH